MWPSAMFMAKDYSHGEFPLFSHSLHHHLSAEELAAIPCGAFPAKLAGLYLWGNVKLIHGLHHLRPGAQKDGMEMIGVRCC